MVTAAHCLVGEIWRLIIDVEVHGLRLASNLGWIGVLGGFGRNYASPKGKRIWQKAFSENAPFRKDREADSGSRLSGLNI